MSLALILKTFHGDTHIRQDIYNHMKRRLFLQTTLAATSLTLTEKRAVADTSEEKTFIINSGIGGNNTVDLLGRIQTDCLAHKPDLTILMIGTNDMNSRKHVLLPEYEKNLRKIIEMILAVKSEILIMSILPVYEPYLYTRHPKEFYGDEGHKGRMDMVNARIKAVAEAYKLHFLDMHHIFAAVGNIGEESSSLIQNMANSNKSDGVHPTKDGYRTMAVAIYEKLKSLEMPCRRLVCFGDSITNGGGGLDGTSYPAFLKKLLSY